MLKKNLYLAILFFSLFGALTLCLIFYQEIEYAIGGIIPYFILQIVFAMGWLASFILGIMNLILCFAFRTLTNNKIKQLTKQLERYERSYQEGVSTENKNAAMKWSYKITMVKSQIEYYQREMAKLSQQG